MDDRSERHDGVGGVITMKFDTVLAALGHRARMQGQRSVFAFLKNGEIETARLSFEELDRQARAVAAGLARYARPGDRALLVYPPGLSFIVGFFGCLYAGVIAVPLQAPRRAQSLEKVRALARDCGARLLLTDAELRDALAAKLLELPDLDGLELLATDALACGEPAAAWELPDVVPESIAFLQYTSGSTGQPKGVCVSHANIVADSEMINQAFEHDESSVMVGWLPTFHDMGLIGNVIQPVYTGFLCVMMPPASFLQKPMRWPKAISAYRATTSGGPNFGYDLCVERFRPAEAEGLDLSTWQVAWNGAEPVRARTLEEFTEVFAPFGFEPRMHHPCYGMAEGTLLITGGPVRDAPRILTVDAAAHDAGPYALGRAVPSTNGAKAKHVVSCGKPQRGQDLRIVHPWTNEELAEGEIGEIWVHGPNVTAGYWEKPDANERAFRTLHSAPNGRRYFRTGDLGFVLAGELYVSGRLKDVIILKGRNLYPQDIELAVERAHPAFQPGGTAAFAVEHADEDRLIVVQEVKRTYRDPAELDDFVAAARAAVAREFEIMAYDIVLVRPLSIPKTSSGKIRRQQCRQQYVSDSLERFAHGFEPSASAVQGAG